jgi:dipeptidyl aminopeptidase/acylaminoacyl peptidase
MSRLSVLIVLLCAGTWHAPAEQPPLIDRELFFGDPEIAGAQISPDGAQIAFIKPLDGVRNVWVKKTEEPFSAARPVTAERKRPIGGYFWSRDSRYILYVRDNDGDENFNVYAVRPSDPPAAGSPAPAARNLTDLKGVRAAIVAVPRSEPDIVYVGLNDRDKAWHDLYRLRISTGERTLVRTNNERITGWVFDNRDQLRLVSRSAENGNNEILAVTAEGLKKVYDCNVLETCTPVRFHKDNRRAWLLTNKGEANLISLALLDPATGHTQTVETDPAGRVDLAQPIFSDLTDELLGVVYIDEKVRIAWRDRRYAADWRWLESKLPGKQISAGSRTRDELRWLITASSDTEPGETYLFDRRKRQLVAQYRIREQLRRDWLAKVEPIRYPSSDGLEIPAYLTLPPGVEPRKLPLVVVPHGGPWARDVWGYHSVAQFLANRGYAVLQPNFRGSTGYGKRFLDAGNGEWGRKMQDDLTWGVRYLIEKGIADPKRVGILGASYGGYAALAGVAFTPEVYAAAVSIVGPSNLITLLESIPPYWEAVRKMFSIRMGDPSTPEGRRRLLEQSPLRAADRIRTPLLVAQGANDPRVNKAESDQIVVALRDRNFPVTYLVVPDEGHGFARPVNSMAVFFAAEEFLARHLGGRYQRDARPEVAARLAEIRVDPKTVTLAPRLAPGALTAAVPEAPLREGADHYDARIEMGGQTIRISLTSTVRDEGELWSVTDVMSSPMGEARETAWMEKPQLALVRRTIEQGPLKIELEFRDNRASGRANMAGQAREISAETGGPVFGDSAGALQSIAALPLREGYQAAIRNFDILKQRSRILILRVTGTETVTVPAGTFEAFKVELTPEDGSADRRTVWVAKQPRKTVKMVATMPQMGGAILTAELK